MHRSLRVTSGLVAALLIAGCGSVTSVSDGGGGAGGGGSGGTGAGGGGGGLTGGGGRGGTGGTTGVAGTTGRGGAAGTAGASGTGGAGGACMFASTYTVRDGGGLIAMADTATLRPPNAFHYERMFFTGDAGRLACDPAMPPCNDADRVDVRDVEAALAHPDVQAAFTLATPPVYGNRAIADGPNFNFMRADGRGFNAGIQCDTPSTTCMPIPPGIVAAVDLLRGLIRQQRMDAECSAIKN